MEIEQAFAEALTKLSGEQWRVSIGELKVEPCLGLDEAVDIRLTANNALLIEDLTR